MQVVKEIQDLEEKERIKNARRNNAKLYPLYKMFSWDLLCFYSIEFLFYTITKGITASEILIITSFYIIFKVLMQIPAVIISDIFGKRKSIIFANILLIVYMIILIISKNMIGIIIADLICSLGYNIKTISETNLLYDSVATKGGEGLYSKLDSRGGSWYYYLDGLTCLVAGYLFVINNYIPVFICLCFLIVSTILSLRFKDIYINKEKKKKNSHIINTIKEYGTDLRTSVKFIIKSRRLKSYIIFGAIFYGIIEIIEVYKGELLTYKGISEEQFSMIFAILTLLAGISVTFSKRTHKKFRNKTLMFLSLTYVVSCLIIGGISKMFTNNVAIPIILILYSILRISDSVWYILEYKYLNNFTTEQKRNKIIFTYETIGGIVASIMSLIGSSILNVFSVENAFILVSLASLALIVLCLDYMRTRFGLKPEQYTKNDIDIL